MTAADPITCLTEREKEVLRAWLSHKSAKEIAIDLGITHHAVEKRLKMARTKLDAGSSREAARMLAGAEGVPQGYQLAVTNPPDLQPALGPSPSQHSRNLVVGGIAVSILTGLGLALAAATQPAEPAEIEIDSDPGKLFAHLDANDSGFLEGRESPFVTLALVEGHARETREGSANTGDGTGPGEVATFYAAADRDVDGRISLAEYTAWSRARWAQLGIEIKAIVKVLPAPES